MIFNFKINIENKCYKVLILIYTIIIHVLTLYCRQQRDLAFLFEVKLKPPLMVDYSKITSLIAIH